MGVPAAFFKAIDSPGDKQGFQLFLPSADKRPGEGLIIAGIPVRFCTKVRNADTAPRCGSADVQACQFVFKCFHKRSICFFHFLLSFHAGCHNTLLQLFGEEDGQKDYRGYGYDGKAH